jgi:hypothetical protein
MVALPTTTIDFAFVMETVAAGQGLAARCEGIPDQCYGLLVSADTTFARFCAAERDFWNFQVIDGSPIRLVRRPVNDAYTSDYIINQSDCVSRAGAPSIIFTRVDRALLPAIVEVQYIDPFRLYDTTTQYAKHIGAPCTNTKMSVSTSFVINPHQAKDMAFDLLYRIWTQQLSARFEHPDLTIEPGDTVTLVTAQAAFQMLVQTATQTRDRTNIIQATVLLTSSGFNPNNSPNFVPVGAGTVAGAPDPGGGGTTSGGSMTSTSELFAGRGSMRVNANVNGAGQINGYATLEGDGGLTVTTTLGGVKQISATMGGRGNLTVVTRGNIYASATLSGSGSIYVSAGRQSISATFTGTGHL